MTHEEARAYLLSLTGGKREVVIRLLNACRELTEDQLSLVLSKAERIIAEG